MRPLPYPPPHTRPTFPMKRLILALAAAPLIAPSAWGDVIYSGYQNLTVPQNFEGVYLNLGTGTSSGSYPGDTAYDTAPWINPFNGGVYIGTSPLLRPVVNSLSANNDDPIRNLSVGTLVSNASTFTPAVNGSTTHVGAGANQFAIGTPGNIGFQFEASVGGPTRYGWMNTTINNTGAGVIRDWAYDNAGGSIVVGRVQQSAPVLGEQTFTLSPGPGENFTLGSAITDTGGNVNSLLKTGTGTTTLGVANNFTGTTTISEGTLRVNGVNSGGGAVTVASAATLGGSGTIAGILGVSGNLAPGAAGADIQTLAAGTTTWNGGSNLWQFDLSAGAGSSDLLAITGAFEKGSAGDYKFDFMGSAPAAWGNAYTLATWTTGTTFDAGDFTFQGLSGSYSGIDSYFTISGNSLTFTAVPEPSSALAGLLIAASLLRRRRASGGTQEELSPANATPCPRC